MHNYISELSYLELNASSLMSMIINHSLSFICLYLSPTNTISFAPDHLYLQVDNKSAAHLLESIIFVIDAVLPLIRKPPQNVVEELEKDLKHMIVRHSYLTVVHACIK